MPVRLSLEAKDGKQYGIYPDRDPMPEGTITENCECVFHLLGDGFDIFGVELTVDGTTLDRSPLSNNHITWRWKINFNAGFVEIDLLGIPSGRIHAELLTDPQVAKLTRDRYSRMVGDILEDTLALAALTGHRIGVVDGSNAPPDIARFEYLRSCIARIEEAVHGVNRSPWGTIRAECEYSKPEKLTNASSRTLADATRYARRLTSDEYERLSLIGRRLSNSMRGCLPARVRVVRSRINHQQREHRDMLAVLLMWQGFVRLVARRLEVEHGGSGRPTPSSILTVIERCGAIDKRVSQLLKLPLFDSVAPTMGPIRPSHLFRRRKNYRQFYEAYTDSLRGLGNIVGEFLRIPLRETFALYELWCFLRLVRAAALENGGQVQHTFETVADGTRLILALRARPFAFETFTITFQPSYTEVWRSDGPVIGSFSHEMRPDIAFEAGSSPIGNDLRPILVFDAKYRAEKEINAAVSSIHMYRDALVSCDNGCLASTHRTIKAGFVLTPNIPGRFQFAPEWRNLAPPAVFFRDEYRNTFRFGAVLLRPGISVSDCRQLLRTILTIIRN